MKRQVHPAATLIAIALLSAAVGHGSLAAQAPQPRLPHAGLPPLNTVSIPQYRAHLHQLQTVVEDCARSAAACDPKRVGPTDDLVHFSGGRDLIERYGWLRDVLHDRNDPLSLRRPSLLPHAMERLRQQEEELDKPLALEPLTRRATSARDHVLARSEFRTNSDYSLSDRLEAWFSEEMGKLFGGFSSLGRMAPWLGTALQWGVLLLAASLLAAWVYRALDRQRIALGRLHGNNVKEAQQAESRAWAERARTHADAGNWREAVHALYWASIVALEDRRTLRRSGTRTPREALRLIDPGSHLREPLQRQTGEFERIWYGLQSAGSEDYQTALASYRALQSGSLKVGNA